MSTVVIPQYLRLPLQTNGRMRNGLYPNAYAQTFMAEETNRIARWRTKAFEHSTPPADLPAKVIGSRIRWRAPFHASTHARYLWIHFLMSKTGLDGALGDPYGKVLVELADGTDVGTAEFHYGANLGATTGLDVPSKWAEGFELVRSGGVPVELTPGTDYYLTFSDENYGRMIAASAYEESLQADTDNGYIQTLSVAGAPIFDSDRSGPIGILREAWKSNASGLVYWSSDTDATAPTRVANTIANIFDQTISAVSASSPGFTLPMARRSTVRRVFVPVRFYVYAKITSGSGNVSLLNSTPTGVQVGPNSAVAQWYTVDDVLVAADDKYDLRLTSNGVGTLTVYAAALIQLAT